MKLASIKTYHSDFQKYANTQKAESVGRFFKTAPGQYGHGDQFLGIAVPTTRSIIKNYSHFGLNEIEQLISSPWHEERLGALLLLSNLGKKTYSNLEQKRIAKFYIKNSTKVNNWDLVDSSAEYALGKYLISLPQPEQKTILLPLIASSNLWQRRISIISTFYLIKQGDPTLTIWVARKLLNDKHDLIHKAVGWMLREVGKRCNEQILINFLQKHYKNLPRTTLRYATEKITLPAPNEPPRAPL